MGGDRGAAPCWLLVDGDDVCVDLQVVPRASRTRAVGEHDGRLRLQVAAPPVDGAANDAVISWLSDTLGVARGRISLRSEQTGKRKRLCVHGVSLHAVQVALTGEVV